MRKRARRYLALMSVFALALIAALLIWRWPTAAFAPQQHAGTSRLYALAWHSQPVGQQQEQLRQLENGDWQLELDLMVEATVQGAPLRYRESERLQFAAAAPHGLRAGSWQRDQNGVIATLHFEQDGNTLSGQRRQDQQVLPVQQAALDYSLADYFAATEWVRHGAAVGERRAIKRLRTESLTVLADQLVVLESGSRWWQQPWRLAWQRADERFTAELVLDPGGIPLSMAIGDAIRLERTDLLAQQTGTDLYLNQTIQTDRALGVARDVVVLQLRWPQTVSLPLTDSPGQVVLPGFVRTDTRKPGLLAALDDLQFALAPEPQYSPDDARLLALARQLTADSNNERDKVSRLLNFVSQHLRNQAVLTDATAAQILRERRGDCTEFSRLFVALARAAAVPAREVSGLVYLGDEAQRFGGHSWAEVIVDGRWLAVDPMWNLMPVSGTHLRMGAGDAGALATTLSRRDVQFTVEQVSYR